MLTTSIQGRAGSGRSSTVLSDEDFRSTNPRLLVPIQEFRITINYNEIYLQQAEQVVLRNILARALYSAATGFDEISPGDFVFGIRELPNEQLEDIEPAYAWGGLQIPVYGCGVQIGPRTTQITKPRTSVTHLLQSLNFMRRVLGALIPPQPIDDCFADAFGLRDRFHRTYFSFDFRLALGENLLNRAKPTSTVEIAKRLMRLGLTPGARTSEAPLGALNFDRVIRADSSVIANRDFGDVTRQLAFSINCPYNVLQKDIDITASVRTGFTGAPFAIGDIHDFETPILLFYRDLVLGQLFEDLFSDYAIEARLS